VGCLKKCNSRPVSSLISSFLFPLKQVSSTHSTHRSVMYLYIFNSRLSRSSVRERGSFSSQPRSPLPPSPSLYYQFSVPFSTPLHLQLRGPSSPSTCHSNAQVKQNDKTDQSNQKSKTPAHRKQASRQGSPKLQSTCFSQPMRPRSSLRSLWPGRLTPVAADEPCLLTPALLSQFFRLISSAPTSSSSG